MVSIRDRELSFGTFVVGASNRLAVSAARAVADAPGQAYNPLFIYGASGRGKTHLVHAIAHRAIEVQQDIRILFTSGEEAAIQLQASIGSGEPHQFLRHLEEADLLILDDVQFLTGQRETQNELLRLLNTLMRDGQQLVLTSDRQPSEIPDVDERLLSRLSGGLVVDVGAPDYEMRLAILRNVSSDRKEEFGDGVLEEVARLAFANVRELKGALNKLSACQQLEGTPVAATDVRAVLGDRRPANEARDRFGAERVSAVIPDGTDYDGFVADVLQEVESHVASWRVQIGEAIAHWRAEGYNVTVLERAMALPVAPDVGGLLKAFARAVDRLRKLEHQSMHIAPHVKGDPAFRNPEDIPAAQRMLRYVQIEALALPAPDPTLVRSRMEVSIGNQLAIRSADSVINDPGGSYNPLLISGPSRSGKTHLAHAIGNAMKVRPFRPAVACLSANQFAEELIAAMQEGEVERWRTRYRSADVLILDDIQHLVDKERTQDELFHLFNHLIDNKRQIVLTSDKPVHELTDLADRLRSRFEGGLVVTLPSREPRKMEHALTHEPGELDRFFEDREKTIWQWPDLGGRLIEDYR